MRTATARPESTFRPRNRPVSKAVVYQKINVNFPVNGPHNILGKSQESLRTASRCGQCEDKKIKKSRIPRGGISPPHPRTPDSSTVNATHRSSQTGDSSRSARAADRGRNARLAVCARVEMPAIMEHNVRRQSAPLKPVDLLINSFAIRSADGSLQSEVIAFHSTGSRPSSRAMRKTAGRRAPKAAEKTSTGAPVICCNVSLVS